jgi:hypothetical protein
MNTIYQKTEKSQRKVKTYDVGEKERAMNVGWYLTYKNPKKDYFIITEDEKCLKFNRTIIL